MQWCLMHAAHTLCCTAAFLQVTAVGAGLLLGSALCIILPEGFEAAIQVLFLGFPGVIHLRWLATLYQQLCGSARYVTYGSMRRVCDRPCASHGYYRAHLSAMLDPGVLITKHCTLISPTPAPSHTPLSCKWSL